MTAAKRRADEKARIDYAPALERYFLSQGIDAHVKAIGQHHDTLHIYWPLMTRPFVYNLAHSPALTEEAPALGFTTAIFQGDRDAYNYVKWVTHWNGSTWVE